MGSWTPQIPEETMYAVTRSNGLASELDGLLNEFFRPVFVRGDRTDAAPIRVDVKETGESYTVHAELPGVKKENIAIEIEGNEVTITAEVKRDSEAKEGEKVLRSERFYGKAARRFALPVEVDETKADARFNDGVLELVLPKKAPVGGRKIQVN